MAKKGTKTDKRTGPDLDRYGRFKQLVDLFPPDSLAELIDVPILSIDAVLNTDGCELPLTVSGSEPTSQEAVSRAIYLCPVINPSWWADGKGEMLWRGRGEAMARMQLGFERIAATGLDRDSLVTLLHRDCGSHLNRTQIEKMLDVLQAFEKNHFPKG